MPKIKNKLNAPLALETGAGGLFLCALEERSCDEKTLESEQVKAAIKAGYLKVFEDEVKPKKKGSEE